MLSSVNTTAASGLLAAGTRPAQTNAATGARDAFSRQLLSILQDGLERLGVPPASVQVARSGSITGAPAASSSSQCQFVVTVPVCDVAKAESQCQAPGDAQRTSAPAAEAGAAASTPGTEEGAMPKILFEQHDGWNWRNYATLEMAQWLAARMGGEVGAYEADWSPGFEPPPTYYTVKFGGVEVNAGQLAVYYQPGDYVNPDRMAAMLISGEGVDNRFVTDNFPELADA